MILQAGQQDVKYMEIVRRSQLSTGIETCGSTCTCTCHSIGICTCTGTGIHTCAVTNIGTCGSTRRGIGGSVGIDTGSGTCIRTDIRAQDVDYCLTIYGLVRFGDNIYFPDSSELKKMILRVFYVKPSSSHPG